MFGLMINVMLSKFYILEYGKQQFTKTCDEKLIYNANNFHMYLKKKNWKKFHVDRGKENAKCHIRNNRKTQARQSSPHDLTLASGLIRQKENLFLKTPI